MVFLTCLAVLCCFEVDREQASLALTPTSAEASRSPRHIWRLRTFEPDTAYDQHTHKAIPICQEVGKRIPLKSNIQQVYEILDRRIEGFHFDVYVLSAAPVEVNQSALEGIVPRDHIFRTEFCYRPSGEIESGLVRLTAGYGKVARLEQLTEATSETVGPRS